MRKPKQKVFSSIVVVPFIETSPFVFEFCRQQQKNPEAFSLNVTETKKNNFSLW